MKYATDPQTNARIEATPGAWAACPVCEQAVLARCGNINVWHWAHRSQADCDEWAEADTAWHHDWQGLFSTEHREVVIGPHRADVAIPGGVLELQHSHLSTDQIRERETFYRRHGHFAWLFDATDAYNSERLELRTSAGRGLYRTFRWKHARKSIAAARAAVYLDLGFAVLKLGQIHPKAPVGGWGHLRTREEFLVEFALDAYRRAS